MGLAQYAIVARDRDGPYFTTETPKTNMRPRKPPLRRQSPQQASRSAKVMKSISACRIGLPAIEQRWGRKRIEEVQSVALKTEEKG